jgi:hypothetical protein
MKRYPATFLTFALVALIVFFYPQQPSKAGSLAAQKRGPRRTVARPVARQTPIDYSRFSHATKKHQAACNTCHKIPTALWNKVRDFPDVADYPGHDACVSCHRPQFFRSAKPPICSVCHSKVSPKDDARFAFRKPLGPRQFLIEFPHDKHQDVIAKLFRRFPVEAGSPAGPHRWRANDQPWFVRVSYKSSLNVDDKAEHYNNCEICHGPRNTPLVAQPSAWVDSFVPDNLTLKSVPVGHAACFNCHWKSEQPVNDNCVGCHKLAASPQLNAVADALPKRFSMKFRHGREQHIAECTTCHINITKAKTLRGLKPDVPITSCATSSCHNNPAGRQDVAKELADIQKDKQFVCSYCHTSDVGRRNAPATHYLTAGMNPVRREEIK